MKIWETKFPAETVLRRWEPALEYRESISSGSASVDSGTVTATADVVAFKGNEGLEVLVSGGAAGETARISVQALTSEGRTIREVFHLAVRSEAPVFGATASEICNFALRRIVGVGETPSADELTDALERLNDMLALWRISGLDVGIAKELEASDVLPVPDVLIAGIKYSLLVDIHDFYSAPLSARDYQRAQEAEAAMRAHLMTFEDFNFDRGLLRRPGGWDFTRGF